MTQTTDTGTKPGRTVRVLRRVLFVLACLITLIAILYAEEDWKGKRAWEKFKTEWEAKGEKFDLKSFAPPPVPDDQNFAMTPFLAPLFDYNPLASEPGQSRMRDPKAYDRAIDFANKLPSPQSSAMWAKSEPVDLPAWAVAMLGKTNVPPGGAASLSRADAANVILKGLEKYQPVLDEIQAATRRPYSRFNINYDSEIPAGIFLPHLTVVKRLSQLFLLRADAELALGQTRPAFSDVKTGLYLSGTMKDEPFLVSGLVRTAILQLAYPSIWEGLAMHQWTDAQLAELETELGGIDLLAEYERQIRGERAGSNGDIDYLRTSRRVNDFFNDAGAGQSSVNLGRLLPDGWFYQNELVINRMHLDYFLPPVNSAMHRVYVDKVSALGPTLTKELFSGFPPYKILGRLLLPALDRAIKKYAYGQENLDLATLACALERYRLAHGQYPESLDGLAPKFIAKIPNDVITGEPLKYRRTDDGQFLLYSVGWNQTDDGGTVAMNGDASPHVDIMQGDWVWPVYPAKGF
jgi:hypothetical protein